MTDRIVVIGSSGAGKSTVAHRLGEVLDSPVIEMDAVYHQPEWEPLELERFRARMQQLTAGERWVTDGNYGTVRDIVWGAADLIVWLDLPRWRVMSRVVRRTAARVATRRLLWNGNREVWRNVIEWDPYENILRWTWETFERRRRQYEVLAALDVGHRWVRLRTPGEVEAFIGSLGNGRRRGPPPR